MIIPISEISAEALVGLAESFVLREGTEYGEDEVPLQQKVEQIVRQLKSGDAVVQYSEVHESFNIITKHAAAQLTFE